MNALSKVLVQAGGCSIRANQRALCMLGAYLLVCSVVALAACSPNAGFGPFKPVFSHRRTLCRA
jgi:hypothetical protein